MNARAPQAFLHLDAELRPHRSMSRRAAWWLLVPVAFVNLVFAVFFLVLGAPVVPPFLGLDVVALAAAFVISFRGVEAFERVRVSADEIRVAHDDGRRVRELWASPTAFTRVDVLAPGEHGVVVRLSCKGRLYAVAQALGPGEREAFGRTLQDAVRAARGERWPV